MCLSFDIHHTIDVYMYICTRNVSIFAIQIYLKNDNFCVPLMCMRVND